MEESYVVVHSPGLEESDTIKSESSTRETLKPEEPVGSAESEQLVKVNAELPTPLSNGQTITTVDKDVTKPQSTVSVPSPALSPSVTTALRSIDAALMLVATAIAVYSVKLGLENLGNLVWL
ncbi:hypothetical protein DIURU_002931 [Diutina rugosa]|uniref:Uncharacterized protein n=1 Tax=Diutina rugosa TaxID=5481 RepID=A0A642UMP7_DIURU|nr:uncharacterized protein DIURU_002931 [Diutina rugosa]KAA8902137.1 hypothetical protein DIURU_002931 [Diutina rugosa]